MHQCANPRLGRLPFLGSGQSPTRCAESTQNCAGPTVMIETFRAVKAYENYVRDLRRALMKAYERKSEHRPMAEHQTREAFKSYRLPWME
jgi:hypothetical protein